MSNLGSYQTMVVLAKRFGSPERLGLAIFGLGCIFTGGSLQHCKSLQAQNPCKSGKSDNFSHLHWYG